MQHVSTIGTQLHYEITDYIHMFSTCQGKCQIKAHIQIQIIRTA